MKKGKIWGLVLAAVLAASGAGAVWMERSRQPTSPAAAAAARGEMAEDGMVRIPGGRFRMGSPDSERQRGRDETAHEVELSDFYVSPYEVSQKEYQEVMGKNPSAHQGEDLPVENVSWYDAAAYCNALSQARGLTPAYQISGTDVVWDRSANGYRLLTEAEWEYAARGGTTGIFPTGDQIRSDAANFNGTYPYLIEENYVSRENPDVQSSADRGETIPVGELPPNAFGLYNMYGNVSEWVFDYYGPYETGNVKDPAGPASGSLRVNRGGAYNDFAKHLRSAYRSVTTPQDWDRNLGFRIARSAQPGEGTVSTSYTLGSIHMPAHPRILTAYFSYSGNTAHAAELLAEKTGSALYRITMAQPYGGNIYEGSQADLMADRRPPLASPVPDMSQYDVILLGYPTWWATMPMPVFTFLESAQWQGKIILPFSSNGGTRFGDSMSDLSKEVPGAYVGHGLEFYYAGGLSLSDDLDGWLADNGVPRR